MGDLLVELKKKYGRRIINYVNGALVYYGIIDAGKMHELTCQSLHLPLEFQDFNELMRDASVDDDDDDLVISFYRKYLHNYNLDDPQGIIREQKARKDLTYRPITENEALAALPLEGNSRRNKHLTKLIAFLMEKGQTADEAVEIAFDLEIDFNNGIDHKDLISQLMDDVVFDKKDDFALLMNLLGDYFNHIPQWALKGWTAEEVYQGSGKPHLSALPTEQFEQISFIDESDNKVGRNDPCPCGSGKKFKKCCLNQDGNSGNGYVDITPEVLIEVKDPGLNQEPAQIDVPQEVWSGAEIEGKPTAEEWANLYAAANEYKAMKCWEWMHEDEIFSVRNPETDELAFVSSMGEIGQVFALNAYLGTVGLDSYFDIANNRDPDEDEQIYLNLNCLTVSFEDRQDLDAADFKIIKQLGLKFRGKKQWPQFRSHRPGYLPWLVNAEECRFLKLIIEQAMNVANRCRDSNQLLIPRNDKILIRTLQGKGEKAKWIDSYSKVEKPAPNYCSFNINNELVLRKMLKQFNKSNVTWEADTFFMLSPIREKKSDRPYLPTMFLVVENDSGMVIDYDLISDTGDLSLCCFERVVGLINRLEIIPKQIVVRKAEFYYCLLEICQQLDIDLKLVEKLKVLPKVREELNSMRKF
jgi:hypothetical protein